MKPLGALGTRASSASTDTRDRLAQNAASRRGRAARVPARVGEGRGDGRGPPAKGRRQATAVGRAEGGSRGDPGNASTTPSPLAPPAPPPGSSSSSSPLLAPARRSAPLSIPPPPPRPPRLLPIPSSLRAPASPLPSSPCSSLLVVLPRPALLPGRAPSSLPRMWLRRRQSDRGLFALKPLYLKNVEFS